MNSYTKSRVASGEWKLNVSVWHHIPIVQPHAAYRAAFYLLLNLSWCEPLVADVESELHALELVRTTATNVQFHHDDGTVQLIRFSKPEVTDESLAPLHHFPHLQYLAIVVPQVTDRGLIYIATRKELDTLMLSGSGITDAGVEVIAGLPKLERLYLDHTAISDAGLERLRNLKTLKVLSLKETAVTSAGLFWLNEHSALEALFLDGTAVDDQGLASLSSLTNLQTLHLNETKVTGGDLRSLAGLSGLKQLNLSGCPIEKLDVTSLATLEQLRTLNLFCVEMDAGEASRLRKQLSQVRLFGVRTASDSLPTARSETTAGERNLESTHSVSEVADPINVRLAAPETDEVPDFQRHVIPLLGRLGCNARTCHGAFQGQAGFRLSLFGYDFQSDHDALTAGDAPRIDRENPSESLILLKPTSELEHEGGERFGKCGWEYQMLYRWIAAGGPSAVAGAPTFVRLEVTPAEIEFRRPREVQQLTAVAVWSDGAREDVTPLTRFSTNDDRVAEVSVAGLVKGVGPGDTHVICTYDNGVTPVPILLSAREKSGADYPVITAATKIDELVNSKLAKLRIIPSKVCRDEEFLRRVSLDLIGTLPTPTEVREFLVDDSPSKRVRKIDELLERPEYVTWWTTRLCDLTGSNAGYLGSTEMATVVASQWQYWIERRVRDNVGWDQITKGILLGTGRDSGQSYEEYIVEQSNYTRSDGPAAYAALDNTMQHYWYRDNQSLPKDKALALGYVFLGVRLECAECHKHPFDRWSQRDFQQFTEFFKRIKSGVAPDAVEMNERTREMLGVPSKLNTAALRRQSYLRIAAEGRPIPWNEVYIEPPGHEPQLARLLGGAEIDLSRCDDPREILVDWILQPDNPYFASAFVNRIWANYFHAGIVDPPDDFNLGNPPSNGPLLDYLRDEFVERGYDMKWLHREITSSDTYQRSVESNPTNVMDERNFSRSVIRRLPAEVIIDAIAQATANSEFLEKVGTKEQVTERNIGDHPRSYQKRGIDYSLLVFGKPLRTTNCDCERRTAPTLLQSLYLRNDHEVFELIDRPEGWLSATTELDAPPGDKNLVEDLFLRTFSRFPTEAECELCLRHFSDIGNREDACRDLAWSLLNAQEFVTNH